MPATDHVWVESSTGLAVLDAALADVHELALDTESNSTFAYRERLCLVQLGFGGAPSAGVEGAMQLYAIDPLAFESPAAANEPLSGAHLIQANLKAGNTCGASRQHAPATAGTARGCNQSWSVFATPPSR